MPTQEHPHQQQQQQQQPNNKQSWQKSMQGEEHHQPSRPRPSQAEPVMSPPSVSSLSANNPPPQLLRCLWKLPSPCECVFADANDLYIHVTLDHIGRRTTNNLSLLCGWDDCSLPEFGKRDHITSHVRIHIPLKPYVCAICRRAFKRPQDRKKHDKLHENQDTKDSPIVKGDSADSLRVPLAIDSIRARRRRSSGQGMWSVFSLQGHKCMILIALAMSAPSSEASSDNNSSPSPLITYSQTSTTPIMSTDQVFSGGSEASFDAHLDHDPPIHLSGGPTSFALGLNGHANLHTPSPPASAFAADPLRVASLPGNGSFQHFPIQTATASQAGFKRTYDPVDDFMVDIKKKKLTSTYDPLLAERLDEIAMYLFDETVETQPGASLAPIDHQPVEDLEELNQFLLQLSNEIDDSANYLNLSPDGTSGYSTQPFMDDVSLQTGPFVSPTSFAPHSQHLTHGQWYDPDGIPKSVVPTSGYHSVQTSSAPAPFLPYTSGLPMPNYNVHNITPAIHLQAVSPMPPYDPSLSFISPVSHTYAPSPDMHDQQHLHQLDNELFFSPAPLQDDYVYAVNQQRLAAYADRAVYAPEREQHMATPYVPTVFNLLPQQSANPASVAPAPASVRRKSLDARKKSTVAAQDADAEAILKQFRDMHIQGQMEKKAAMPAPAATKLPKRNPVARALHSSSSGMNAASALVLRKRHSVLVKTLMQRVADKISRVKA
ncbi:hypothetical protein HKX48_009037 [Thoreauomyces humboldtii]|nr:hypothetical protein HKX48_009037 [Thoreauomyces humboldtii]